MIADFKLSCEIFSAALSTTSIFFKCMEAFVFRVRHQCKVFPSVVRRVMVYVVDMFITAKKSPDMLFYNQSMLCNVPLPRRNRMVWDIFIPIATSINSFFSSCYSTTGIRAIQSGAFRVFWDKVCTAYQTRFPFSIFCLFFLKSKCALTTAIFLIYRAICPKLFRTIRAYFENLHVVASRYTCGHVLAPWFKITNG